MIPHTKKGLTCEFTLENLCFGSSALAFVRLEESFSGMLEDMIWKQTIHNISNILEWCVDIWEQDRDMVGGQVSSNPKYPNWLLYCCMSTSNTITHLDETRAAAASSSADKGTTGGRRGCKRLDDGSTGGRSSGVEVLAEGINWALGEGGEVAERGEGSLL